MGTARSFVQIVRPASSMLTFLSILVPVFARTRELSLSFKAAVPLLFISMCTFVINDLDDIEKDQVNHPERPLPSGQLKPRSAAILYYICLLSALVSLRLFVGDPSISFLYYSMLALCMSYSYTVEYLPAIKPLYVASVASIPVLILLSYYPEEAFLYWIAIALFFFTLGRELCMDLLDRPGDPISALHKVGPGRVAAFAFFFQAAGLILLLPQVRDLLGFVVVLAIAVLFALSYIYWFHRERENVAVALMKLTMFLGLYFLI